MEKTDILLVEPSRQLAGVITEAFELKGLTCAAAYSAQGGILKADTHKPELIILELLIARHNGVEFIHELRSYPDWLDIPLILYTSISRDELQLNDRMLEEMGIISHLYKPTTSLDRLVSTVEAEFALQRN